MTNTVNCLYVFIYVRCPVQYWFGVTHILNVLGDVTKMKFSQINIKCLISIC